MEAYGAIGLMSRGKVASRRYSREGWFITYVTDTLFRIVIGDPFPETGQRQIGSFISCKHMEKLQGLMFEVSI